MKKLFLSAIAVMALSTVTTFAQTAPAPQDLESRVASVTRDMSVKLGLNESDYIKVKNLNRERLVKADEIANTYKNDASMRNSKLAELQTTYDNQLSSILNSKQKEAYASYKTSNSSYTALEEEKK